MNQAAAVAWRVEIDGIDGIVFAATRAKASWIAIASYLEVYERRDGLPKRKIRRCKEYDGFPHKQRRQGFSEEYVKMELAKCTASPT